MRKLSLVPALFALGFGFALNSAEAATAVPVPVTILHTNDLHSHFRPEKTLLNLGGVARIKTAVSRIRAKVPNALLVDGGDWSEGNIYYTEGAGRETLQMMDRIGYDVAVVGNHDWLNGPDTLLSAIEDAHPKMTLVGANFNADQYSRANEFHQLVQPYAIRQVGNAKIAFIGLGTYEIIYDKFFAPITITEPFASTEQLAAELKKTVDAVVVISHNRIATNKSILTAAPDVDLIIGAHDHVKLTTPVIVNRTGAKPGWIVETGCWGRYLGRVDMKVTPRTDSTPPSVDLVSYKLLQMDRTIPEDPAIDDDISKLETVIEGRLGSKIFSDSLGKSEIELYRDGVETPMGNFTADAFRNFAGADIAMDERNFIYGELHTGTINSSDVFNSNPAIFNPQTGRSWTLKTIPMSGSTLKWILNVFLGWKQLALSQTLVFSGVQAVYNPVGAGSAPDPGLLLGFSLPEGLSNSLPIQSINIGGQPLDPSRTYKVAIGGGVVEAIKFLDSLLPNLVPADQMQDTGIESWRIMADYVHASSPLNYSNVQVGGRLTTLQPDLGILYDDVTWVPGKKSPGGLSAKIRVRVRNFGANPSPALGAELNLLVNRNGANFAIDPQLVALGAPQSIPPLAPGDTQDFTWDVVLPDLSAGTRNEGLYPVTASISGNTGEVNATNDTVTHWFSAN